MSKQSFDWLVGIHAVTAALKTGRRQVYELHATSQVMARLAPFFGRGDVKIIETDRQALDKRFPGQVHQGVAAKVGPLPQPALEDLAQTATLLLMLDQVTDPHNLGAVLRSADAFGCDGVIVAAHGGADVTQTVAKTASGALEAVPVVAGNLNQAIEKLKKAGFWVVGLAGEATKTIDEMDFKGKTLLVLGSEGEGLRDLVRKNCDFLAKIPIQGKAVDSLNVSVAAGVALYAASQRRGKKSSA